MVRLELPVNQEIVHNAACRVEHHSVEDLAGLESADVIGEDMVHILLRIGSADEDLTHVGDVEHSDLVTDSIVLVGYVGVLDRHDESCERTHLGSQCNVAVIETGFLEILFHIIGYLRFQRLIQASGAE